MAELTIRKDQGSSKPVDHVSKAVPHQKTDQALTNEDRSQKSHCQQSTVPKTPLEVKPEKSNNAVNAVNSEMRRLKQVEEIQQQPDNVCAAEEKKPTKPVLTNKEQHSVDSLSALDRLIGNIMFYYFDKYRYDPESFLIEVLGFVEEKALHDWQKEVCQHVGEHFRKFSDHEHSLCGVIIAGANGTGKSELGKALLIWRFCCWPGSRQFILTNSEQQTKRVLLKSLTKKLLSLYKALGAKGVFAKEEEISFYMRFGKERGSDFEFDTKGQWEFRLLYQSSSEAALSGLHSPAMSFFFDEAVSFPQHIWRAMDTMTTQGHILCYVSSNPTTTTDPEGGYNGFYTTLKRAEEDAVKGISPLESSYSWFARRVTTLELRPGSINQAAIQRRLLVYGENSSHYQSSVLARFPQELAYRRFSVDKIVRAMGDHELNPRLQIDQRIFVGIDVAETPTHGSKTAYCVRRGNEVLALKTYEGVLTDFLGVLMSVLVNVKPHAVIVDSNGVGYSLFMGLQSYEHSTGCKVFGVKFHASSPFEGIANRYTELAWKAGEWLTNGVPEEGDPLIKLPYNHTLINVLSHMDFSDADGQLKLVGKNSARETGGTDLFDAFVLTFAHEAEELQNSNFSMSGDRGNNFMQWSGSYGSLNSGMLY